MTQLKWIADFLGLAGVWAVLLLFAVILGA